MLKPAGSADYKISMVLDVLGTVAIGAYVAMSFRGPVPTWVQVLYLVGCVAGGAAAFFRRNYFSLACFVVGALITIHQLTSVVQIPN